CSFIRITARSITVVDEALETSCELLQGIAFLRAFRQFDLYFFEHRRHIGQQLCFTASDEQPVIYAEEIITVQYALRKRKAVVLDELVVLANRQIQEQIAAEHRLSLHPGHLSAVEKL